MNLVSMKTEPESYGVDAVAPDCCPRIYLTDDQVEALGITGMPPPGTVFMIQAKAVVTRTSAHAEEAEEVPTEGMKPDVCLDLKITDMGVQRASASNAEVAKALYGEGE